MSRLIQDGKVAVIYSEGFGDNWSTQIDYANGDLRELACCESRLVEAVLNKDYTTLREIAKEIISPTFHVGENMDLAIEWIPIGVRFFIDENEGKETIHRDDEIFWLTA